MLGNISGVRYYRIKTMATIAICWTIVDAVSVYIFRGVDPTLSESTYFYRGVTVFIMSFFIGYFFPTTIRRIVRQYPFWINLLLKLSAALVAAILMNFCVYLIEACLGAGESLQSALQSFFRESRYTDWMLQRTFYWLLLLILTQLYIEINEKYAPGVFKDIVLGKYYLPKEEDRILLFIDLRDSTPIAEKLGHKRYFLFIRDFINLVSVAAIEHYGRIYQYVGDEIIVSWPANANNAHRAMRTVIHAKKLIQKRSDKFRRLYNEVPSFRVGIHAGRVTVGEIGVIKKDLAISGDTMNTTARIKNACAEFGVSYIVSEDYQELAQLPSSQIEFLGDIELKGKSYTEKLYALNI